jgi:DNA-binding transcriptional ArsR family regulator
MLDELRQQIQTYLDQLLGEADKLRHALIALGSRDGAATPPSAAPSAAPERARRRSGSAPASRTVTRKPARPRASAVTTTASAEPVEPPASAPASGSAGTPARAASGSTKNAVLHALAGGNAMTAGEIATATGLGRATVSTTLSKLAKSGEVTKAARGYQLAGQTPTNVPADAAPSADGEQPGT